MKENTIKNNGTLTEILTLLMESECLQDVKILEYAKKFSAFKKKKKKRRGEFFHSLLHLSYYKNDYRKCKQ